MIKAAGRCALTRAHRFAPCSALSRRARALGGHRPPLQTGREKVFVTKRFLSRRTWLQGAGAAIGLPFLESMIPAFTPLVRAATPPLRFGVTYIPNGAIMQQFSPAATGEGFAFTPILKPL